MCQPHYAFSDAKYWGMVERYGMIKRKHVKRRAFGNLL